MSFTQPNDGIRLRPALWAQGPSFVTESYLGEYTPDLLRSIGIELEDHVERSLDEDAELLFGPGPTKPA